MYYYLQITMINRTSNFDFVDLAIKMVENEKSVGED